MEDSNTNRVTDKVQIQLENIKQTGMLPQDGITSVGIAKLLRMDGNPVINFK